VEGKKNPSAQYRLFEIRFIGRQRVDETHPRIPRRVFSSRFTVSSSRYRVRFCSSCAGDVRGTPSGPFVKRVERARVKSGPSTTVAVVRAGRIGDNRRRCRAARKGPCVRGANIIFTAYDAVFIGGHVVRVQVRRLRFRGVLSRRYEVSQTVELQIPTYE